MTSLMAREVPVARGKKRKLNSRIDLTPNDWLQVDFVRHYFRNQKDDTCRNLIVVPKSA
jgi:hypothetical protein